MRTLWTCLLLIFSAFPCHAEETSETNPQLHRWLLKFPKADANEDGVLTQTEARDYRQSQQKQRQQRNSRQSTARSTPTHANVKYGPANRNVLDLYLVESDEPTPLVIYIHGGGFVAGDKRTVSSRVIAMCHDAGISVASIHYRFVTESPFPAPQLDAARAVQYLRANADKWNLDSDHFAAYGGSAGAGLSMWLGFHDDLADPDAEDPVQRESTRLSAIGSFGGQSTYDPNVIKEWIGGRAHEHPSIYLCYRIKSIAEIAGADLQPLYNEVSAITHLTADDPPIFMVYSEADAPLPQNARPGQGIHHPIFGHKLKAEMDKLEIESIYRHTRDRKDIESELVEFFKKHLGVDMASVN